MFKKGLVDFVIVVDLKVEEIFIEELSCVCFGYGFLVEELGMVDGIDKIYCWIIDLLDGMMNFFYGFLYFVVLIGLE